MQRSIHLNLSLAGTAVLALALLPFDIRPAAAQDPEAPDTEAADLGVMSANLRDAVKFKYGFQGALQGAGTPNQAGIGAFIPLHVGRNSVAFLDVLVNANFNDYGNYSSIVKTTVAGTTFSTSTRLGYRWLNRNRSLMYGINAGYDSRPMATGPADTGAELTFNNTVFFQQASVNLEASSNKLNLNAYALVPFGSGSVSDGTVYVLNDYYLAGALNTYGFNAGYNLAPGLRVSVGYYYQNGDLGEADGSGFLGRVEYDLVDSLTLGVSLSYDQAYETRVSGNVKYRFGGNGYRSPGKKYAQSMPVIQALTVTPGNRDVRVHDAPLADLLMMRGLAFAPGTSKVIGEQDVKDVANFLKNGNVSSSETTWHFSRGDREGDLTGDRGDGVVAAGDLLTHSFSGTTLRVTDSLIDTGLVLYPRPNTSNFSTSSPRDVPTGKLQLDGMGLRAVCGKNPDSLNRLSLCQ